MVQFVTIRCLDTAVDQVSENKCISKLKSTVTAAEPHPSSSSPLFTAGRDEVVTHADLPQSPTTNQACATPQQGAQRNHIEQDRHGPGLSPTDTCSAVPGKSGCKLLISRVTHLDSRVPSRVDDVPALYPGDCGHVACQHGPRGARRSAGHSGQHGVEVEVWDWVLCGRVGGCTLRCCAAWLAMFSPFVCTFRSSVDEV